ncbi:carbohydrate sulfotransferase 8-10 [Fadolivirus algeromassiliense]|jgi:hypothetical protein|uniref:Carbohydrate sulfotransferase 8-10 n=1 Tax=Fadolivirus FV1/VV64 TaxID=3070911 RepID=A0A7D3R2V3_9VIRU|nr:carbohydrate sulfotransferase 8-10 [Fadolivirus algeromassiliense]QKF94758.1 carbohydrate sulfotransferase 8-10 [Fadolivirus FV1/VV64]
MDAYIINSKTLIFWTPKCACTSLFNIIKEIKKIKCERYGQEIFVNINNENIDCFNEYTKIILVRNPYDRVLSAYINKFICHPQFGKLDKFEKLENFAKELVINNKNTFYNNDTYVGLSFNEFIEILKDNHKLDVHWDKQKKLDNIKFDYIVHVEDFEKELKEVFSKLEITTNFTIPHENKTNYSNISKLDLSNIKSVDIINNYLDVINKDSLLNTSNKENIYTIYKDDFELGNYTV